MRTIKSVQSMPRNSPGKYLALATLYSQYLIYDTTHRKGTKAEIDSLVNKVKKLDWATNTIGYLTMIFIGIGFDSAMHNGAF